MSVKQLIEILSRLPPEAVVLRQGDEFIGDQRGIYEVEYFPKSSLGQIGNAVVLK